MNDEEKRKKRLELVDIKWMLTLAGAGCIIVLFYLLIGKLGLILGGIIKVIKAAAAIINGAVIAFLLNPLVNKLRVKNKEFLEKLFPKTDKDKLKKIADALAVIFAMLFLLLGIAALLWVLIPSVYDSLNKFYDNIDTYTDNVTSWGNKLLKDNEKILALVNTYVVDFESILKNLLNEKLIPNMDTIVKTLSSGIVGGLKILLNFIIGIIAAIYILLSKDKFSAQGKKVIYAICGRERGNKFLSAWDFTDGVFGGFISGKIADSLIIGLICFIFCTIVNMPYAVLISVVVGITNIIPFFGPFIGAIPSSILVLVDSPKMCLVFVIFIIILQQVDGNIIGPLILGDSTGLSSFWVLFAILVGGNLFGFMGMILGVPAFACVYTLATIILRDVLEKRGLTNETDFYVSLRSIDDDNQPVKGKKKRFESVSGHKKRERIQKSKEAIEKKAAEALKRNDQTSNLKKESKEDSEDKTDK